MHVQLATVKDLFDKAVHFCHAPDSRLHILQDHGCYPFFKEFTGYEECASAAEVRMGDRKILMFGSNNYLGLTTDPRLKEAAIAAIHRYGTGCSGSRMLNGTIDLHNQLEAELAAFMQQEAALLFGTGFQTNHGAIPALADRGDCILADRHVHASIVDGMQTSHARSIRFRHNDMDQLEHLLQERSPQEAKLILVDGVYSMEGDTADLPSLVNLSRAHGARLFLDDAHGIGVLGENGRGTAEHYGVEDGIDVYAGTFSKSFASAGGFIAARKEVIDYVKHHSRAFIYSASIPASALATVRTALQIIQTEPERRVHLQHISNLCRAELRRVGFEVYDGFTPVVPVVIDNELLVGRFCNELLEEGVYVNPVFTPAVTKSLLRISCMAVHTEAHVDQLVEAMVKVARRLGFWALPQREKIA